MLKKISALIKNLEIYPENMTENLNLTRGLIFSQAVLLALTQKGVSREESYRMVQRNAMKVWEQKIDFSEALEQDSGISEHISAEELRSIFQIENRLKNIDHIFKEVGIY